MTLSAVSAVGISSDIRKPREKAIGIDEVLLYISVAAEKSLFAAGHLYMAEIEHLKCRCPGSDCKRGTENGA